MFRSGCPIRTYPKVTQRFCRQDIFRPVMNRRYKSGPFGYTMAQALVYMKHGEPDDVLSLHHHSITPTLPSDSIFLRTLASPINPADINQIQGVYPLKPEFSPLLGTPLPSAVGGNEGCFEVVSVGSSVTDVRKGDWVVANTPALGTWRTHLIARKSDILPVDKKGLTATQVCTASINPRTAYCMLKNFEKLHKGDWWIQNGANSSVGRAAIQLGNIWGFKSINVIRDRLDVVSTESLRTELLELGATHVVTETELLDRGFRELVTKWTKDNNEGIRLGLNCVGGKSTTALVKLLGKRGHLITYGGMSRQPLQVPTSRLIFDDIRFSGFWISRWSADNPLEGQQMLNKVLDLIRTGSLKETPHHEILWNWDTKIQVLNEGIKGTLQGYRKAKNVIVYGDT
ncbi:Enoyl- reductase, mitochondrial [Golovinomyces cichoracearum]|uniref:enoyl-[acyl-carrier-protein] reductase n=1 Tax=Golovinomyces cichoracearum TaxID=62708 RepID=A0A420IPZ5_9PEZI|nr:Enoyl- reductase, mitochondrial [Golovinomyces cichoracearum]